MNTSVTDEMSTKPYTTASACADTVLESTSDEIKWISVKESLPEGLVEVVGEGWERSMLAAYSVRDGEWIDESGCVLPGFGPTHWTARCWHCEGTGIKEHRGSLGFVEFEPAEGSSLYPKCPKCAAI